MNQDVEKHPLHTEPVQGLDAAAGVEAPRKKRQPNRGEDEPWSNEDLEAMRQQAKDTSLAGKQAYINALEYELQEALTRRVGVVDSETDRAAMTSTTAKE
jgi:hypothetical protein